VVRWHWCSSRATGTSAPAGVTVRTLEITKPTLLAQREADGIHMLGLIVKLPQHADGPETPASPEQPAAVQAAAQVAPAPAPTAPKPAAEQRIDKLVISGINVRVEDRTVRPPLIVPLNSLEAEVRDLSNMALYEARPIRFHVLAGAGKVALGEDPTQKREVFSRARRQRASVALPSAARVGAVVDERFELLALRGLAAEKKVNIERGLFDSHVEVRFRDDGSLDTRSSAVVRRELQSPRDRVRRGPIQRRVIPRSQWRLKHRPPRAATARRRRRQVPISTAAARR
jgi:hypothetical protein